MVREDSTSSHITHPYWASHMRNLKKILEGPKTYHN
jgi:hypothetical protein